MRGRLAAPPVLAAAVVLALVRPAAAHKPTVTNFTYYADILPIFRAKCGGCHREGGVAPMSLLDYRSAYPWAIAIKTEVLALSMPPWYADERYGSFARPGGLTATEMNTLVDWCLGGAPEGEPPSSPAPPENGGGWSLGEPDAVLEMSAPVTLESDENEATRVVLLPTAFETDRSVVAVDLRPGSASVVRSAVAEVIADGESTLLGAWIPGQSPLPLPDGLGRRLPPGATLRLSLRYGKTWLDEGQEIVDRSALALYFGDADAERRVESLPLDARGAPEEEGGRFTVRAHHTLAERGELVELVPRLTTNLAALVAEAVRPDGSRFPLLRLDDPGRDWTRPYRLESPLVLEAGTRLELTVTARERESLASEQSLLLELATP